MYEKDKVLERFWKKVNKNSGIFGIDGKYPTECWIWIAALKDGSYGGFGFRERVRRAHQVSWIIHFGEIPEKLCVCHKCDNPKCIRPDHLFTGTHSQNIKDAYDKGRVKRPTKQAVGTQRKTAKLDDDKIKDMREKYRSGLYSYKDLSEIYKVCTRTVGHIIHKRKWKHVN